MILKKVKNWVFVFTVGLAMLTINANAQFEQKFTLNLSLGNVVPNYYTFNNGFSFDGGVQYNMSKAFSLYGKLRIFTLLDSKYSSSYYYNTALGIGLQYKFLTSKKINPYVFGEANINYVYYKYFNKELEWDEVFHRWNEGYYSDALNAISPGVYSGIGVNININENIGLFVQSGYYISFYDEFSAIYSQLGLNISFLKSKYL
jgi:hypothetical protein